MVLLILGNPIEGFTYYVCKDNNHAHEEGDRLAMGGDYWIGELQDPAKTEVVSLSLED